MNHLAVIIIDDIDTICTKRSEYDHENTQIVSQLLTCIDGLKTTNRVLVIGTTTKPYLLDNALRRAGRFDKEVSILPPTQEQRECILSMYFKSYNLLEIVQDYLPELSLLTRGFSGADIEMYVRNVVLESVQSSLLTQQDQHSIINLSFLVSLLGTIKPSIMKDQERVTGIHWDAIGGMTGIKTQLRQVYTTDKS